ncbi:HEPN domain-containing protein [Streptomyces sp. WM6368]|uniref:ApeA N-terminal domain 1-containing protein n=1 Tax=Streptomyces sp. WM6368 TaxID=1415554 RepID=UPI000B1D6AEB|nr:HEPN domain-containing protein [Streptomyces sp. WM6368]
MAQSENAKSDVAEWWLPERPDLKVAGTYTRLNSGNALARLHGSLEGRDGTFFSSVNNYPLVHGEVFGKSVTLVNARVGSGRFGGGDLIDVELRPAVAIEGLLLDEDELSVTEAKVRIQHQDEWVQPSTFAARKDSRGFLSEVSIRDFPQRLASIENGFVGITDFSSSRWNSTELSIINRSGFHFCFESPVSLTSFFDEHLRGLQVLMTLVTGTRCGIESLSFTNETWLVNGVAPATPPWVEVRVRAPEEGKSKRNDLLFSLSSLDWERQAPRIFDLSIAWMYAIEQWALLLDDRFVWPVARFSTAASAVEALDRVLTPDEKYEPDAALISRVVEALRETSLNGKDRRKVKSALERPREVSLEQRIRRLTQCAPEAMADIVGDPQWPARVARLRHVVSHGLQSSEKLWKDVRSVECGSEILIHLLECAFLFHLGFDRDRIREMKMRHASTAWRKSVVDQCMNLLPSIGETPVTVVAPSASDTQHVPDAGTTP